MCVGSFVDVFFFMSDFGGVEQGCGGWFGEEFGWCPDCWFEWCGLSVVELSVVVVCFWCVGVGVSGCVTVVVSVWC